MKAFDKILGVSLLVASLTFGCRPEGVGPTGSGGKENHISAAEYEWPVLNPVCGNAKTYVLVGLDGSETVNRCFGSSQQGYSLVPCGSNMPAWGTVTVMNGLEDYIANVSLAPGWFGQAEAYQTADPNTYVLDNTGFPIVGSGWSQRAINPIVGKWQVARSLGTTGNNFGLAMRLTVVAVDFMGDVIPGSETTLWLRDPEVETTVSTPYVAVWSRNFCQPALPGTEVVCKTLNVGVSQLSNCMTLEPTITAPVGPATYSWSTGATTATISVCPTTTTSYNVTVSDNSGPRAVYQYDVNVRNVACQQGNSNSARVSVCHIPPGNPSNASTQCLNWSAVRNHIAEYRGNSNSSQNHNSGCTIGACGTNPCNN